MLSSPEMVAPGSPKLTGCITLGVLRAIGYVGVIGCDIANYEINQPLKGGHDQVFGPQMPLLGHGDVNVIETPNWAPQCTNGCDITAKYTPSLCCVTCLWGYVIVFVTLLLNCFSAKRTESKPLPSFLGWNFVKPDGARSRDSLNSCQRIKLDSVHTWHGGAICELLRDLPHSRSHAGRNSWQHYLPSHQQVL